MKFAERNILQTRLWRLAPPSNPDSRDPSSGSFRSVPTDDHALPFKVELWSDTKAAVDRILAITSSASIGFAAYYAAVKEFPDRAITLRHKNGVVARWNPNNH